MNITIPAETLTMKILYKRLNAFEAERRMTDEMIKPIDFWPPLATTEALVLTDRMYQVEITQGSHTTVQEGAWAGNIAW